MRERARTGRRGFRTHILVSVGSALIMLVSAYGFSGAVQFWRKCRSSDCCPGSHRGRLLEPGQFSATEYRHRTHYCRVPLDCFRNWARRGNWFLYGCCFCYLMVLINLIVLRSLENYFARKKSLRRLWVKGFTSRDF